MPGDHSDDLGDYGYARRIAAESSGMSLGERFRMIRASPEHKRRQLLARTRASWMGIAGLSALAIFYALILATGSVDTPDSLQLVIIALIALMGLTVGWHIGTRRARAKLASADRG
jgi:hypothetical protein